jgi:signal peptidase I
MSTALEPMLEPQSVASTDAAPMREPAEARLTASLPRSAAAHFGLLDAVQSLLYVITVAVFIIAFIAQPFRIPSESMVPTLLVGDFLLVDKQVGNEPAFSPFAPANAIHRGDLVVFHYPVDPTLHLVKRVVGLPGDRLHLSDGRVVVNGKALDESYAYFSPAAADSYRDQFPRFTSADPGVDTRWWIEMRSLVHGGDLTIPAGHYFVLGDNRNDSEDSRYWGLVPQQNIVGKPFLVYFSLNTPAATPGQTFASALQVKNSPEVTATSKGMARWNRAFHVIR